MGCCPSVRGWLLWWLSLALVACSSCLTAEAVVALLVGSLCPFLSLWLVWLVLALGWVVTAVVARCLALGWLSVFAALLGSLRLLWLSLGRLVCSGSVSSPCGSLARYTLAEALVVGFPECSCKVVVTLLLPIKEGLYLELFRGVKFCKIRQTLYPKQKTQSKVKLWG